MNEGTTTLDTPARREWRKLASFVVKMSFSASVLLWLFYRTDVARVMTTLRSVSGAAVAVALLLLAVQTMVTAYRWVAVSNAEIGRASCRERVYVLV